MKLLKLTIENIHSLYGRTEIDFCKEPLSETGLFAIIGDTGAGKSTILDAITIALFRQIARNGSDVRDSLSKGTANGMVELIFEGKDNKNYKSVWSVRRARNNIAGELQNQQVELSNSDTGEILASQIREFDRLIPEVLGLSFEQFKRTVLLAQGDFATFFKANDNERAEILEKLTQTGIFRRLSIKCYEYTKQLQEAVDSLKTQKSSLNLLDEVQVTELNNELETLKEEGKNKNIEAQLIRDERQRVNTIETLELELNEAHTKLSGLEKTLNINQELYDSVDLQIKARPAFEVYERVNKEQESKSTLEQTLIDERAQEEQLLKEIEALKSDLSEKQKTYQNAEDTQKSLGPGLQKAIKLRDDINRITEEGKDLAYQKSSLETELTTIKSGLENIRVNLKNQDSKIVENKNSLSQKPDIKVLSSLIETLKIKDAEYVLLRTSLTNSAKSIETLKGEIESENKNLIEKTEKSKTLNRELEDARLNLQDLEGQKTKVLYEKNLPLLNDEKSKAEQLLALLPVKLASLEKAAAKEQELTNFTVGLQSLRTDLEANQKLVEDRQLEVNKAQTRFEDKKKIKELNAKVKFYEEDRLILKEGDPCPLCGSAHHQLDNLIRSEDTIVIEADFVTAEQLLKQAESELQVVKNERISLETKLESNGKQLTELKKQGLLLQSEAAEAELWLKELRTNYQIDEGQEHLVLTETISSVSQQINEVVRLDGLIETGREKQKDLELLLSPIQLAISGIESSIKSKTEQFSQNQVTHSRLKDELLTAKQNLEALAQEAGFEWGPNLITDLDTTKTDIETLQESTIKLEKSLNELKIKENETLSKLENTEKNILSKEEELVKKRKEVAEKMVLKRAILPDHQDPQEQLESLENVKQTALSNKEAAQSNYTRANESLIRVQEKIISGKDRIEKAKKDIENLKIELIGLLKNLNLNETYLSSAKQFTPKELEEIKQEQQTLLNQILVMQKTISVTSEKLNLEKSKGPILKSEENLNTDLETSENLLSEINQKIGAINQTLAINEKARQDAAFLIKEIEEKQLEHQHWSRLNSYIGSANGDRFVRVAQWHSLAHLTRLANRQLKLLTDRYLLSNNSDQTKLDLWVTDTYQGDTVRSVSSLSGGESFLVSLAMALGLSQMASGQTKIDSLFIDEGFGTLDSNTLEVALNSLERLQHQGKTVGIISHVPQLKERISTQIQVIKKGRGRSEVEIKQG